MDTFIIIAAIVLFIISSLGDSKKKAPSKKRLPPIKNPAPQHSAKQKKTYDYMLNKPSPKDTKNNSNRIEEEKKPAVPSSQPAVQTISDKPSLTVSTSALVNSSMQNPPADTDFISNIPAAKQKNLSIDIHRQAVLQAITYAEVLSPPKSLKYLARFGIKRFPMK